MKTTKEKIEVMTAYEEGKKIKCIDRRDAKVEYIFDNSNDRELDWNWISYDYQVYEEPKCRPYKDIDELFKDWAEKTHNIPANMEKYVRPLIWIKAKIDGTERLIADYDRKNEHLKSANNWISLEYLFNNYTFIDESPCGKKE